MSDKKTFYLDNPFIRQNAIAAINNAPEGWIVEIKQETRTLAQNRKLWACLTDLAQQVEWDGEYLNQSDWKNMVTAGLTKATSVRGIEDGTFVMRGSSTSSMSKKLFIELVEYIHWFGTDKNVIWSRDSVDIFTEYLKKNKGVMQ